MTPSAISPLPTSPEDTTLATLRTTLLSESSPLASRFRALFSLKHLASTTLTPTSPSQTPALTAITKCLTTSSSALLKHEVAYCLGQTRNLAAVPTLQAVLRDLREDAMVRHEAAEALGALGDRGSLELLGEFRDRVGEEGVVRETCEIAVERIRWELEKRGEEVNVRKSDFASIDPAPPLPQDDKITPTIPELEKVLLDTNLPLFHRYRSMFALRDLASPPTLPTATPAVLSLAKGFADPSPLFRHEIAFVFGQLSHPASIPSLVAALGNQNEMAMVRHEAAEALGSLGEEEGVEDVLKGFLEDPVEVVRESVVVALDMAEYERSGEVEYALVPEGIAV
ncbi:Uncharacterized protein Vi05172_g13715 [Venturia inaequalis]|nr:Uncharacterized protein Vi05172_g13715 [Venturia inaequalis]